MKKKVKKKTLSQLRKELDKVFSLYVRKKYSTNGIANCYTCGATKNINELQCGHFVSRAYLGTRYEENNVRPQCVGCNVFGGGKTAQFAYYLERDLDSEITSRLYRQARQIVKDYPYEAKIAEYQEKLNAL